MNKIYYKIKNENDIEYELPLLSGMKLYKYVSVWVHGIYLIPFKYSPEMDEFLKEFDMFKFTDVQMYSKEYGLLVIRYVKFDICETTPLITTSFVDFPYIELYKTSYDENMEIIRTSRIIGPTTFNKKFVQTYIDLEDDNVNTRLHMFEIENDILMNFKWEEKKKKNFVDVWDQEHNKKIFHTLLNDHMLKFKLDTTHVEINLDYNLKKRTGIISE